MPRSVLDSWRKILLPLCAGVLMQAQVVTPRAGFVRCDDGTVRAAQGIEAAFVLGKPVAVAVDAASFSDQGGLISTRGIIRLLHEDGSEAGDYESGERHAVLSIEGDLSTAAAWLPSAQTILHWDGGSFARTVLRAALPGQVTSLRLLEHTAELLVEKDGSVSAVTVSLDSGDELSARFLAGVSGPAVHHKTWVVYRDENGLEFESADGSRRTLPFSSSDLTIEHMASDWLDVQSRKTNQHWALHVTKTALRISQLPASPVSGGVK